jgi:hypothetical protein
VLPGVRPVFRGVIGSVRNEQAAAMLFLMYVCHGMLHG